MSLIAVNILYLIAIFLRCFLQCYISFMFDARTDPFHLICDSLHEHLRMYIDFQTAHELISVIY